MPTPKKPLWAFHMPKWPTVLGWVTGWAAMILPNVGAIPSSVVAKYPWLPVTVMFVAGGVLWLTKKPGSPPTAVLVAEGTELLQYRASSPPPLPVAKPGAPS